MEGEYDYLENYEFYHGYARYAQWGAWEHVFTACYDESEKLKEATDDLCGGDCEAIGAMRIINQMVKDGIAYLGTDKDPVEAMRKCVEKIKEAQAT